MLLYVYTDSLSISSVLGLLQTKAFTTVANESFYPCVLQTEGSSKGSGQDSGGFFPSFFRGATSFGGK